MRNLLNPKWLLLLHTGPLLILALLCYGEFTVIHTLLPPASVALWQQFGWGLGALGLATVLVAGWHWGQGRELGIGYAGATLLAYTLYLGLCTQHSQQLLPFAIPQWMVPTDPVLYVWTFLMPTLFHALLVLVLHTTPPGRPYSSLPSFGLAVAVPMGSALVFSILGVIGRGFIDFWHAPTWVTDLVMVGALTLGPLAFLFFLVRGIYILSTNRQDPDLTLVWKFILTLLLPLLGLAVNAGLLWGGGGSERGIFGNFNSPWFYGLAALNGVLLCLPAPAAPRWRLALLLGRSMLLGYTGYFFLVFLPFLPLSIFAVIILGLGFLMLAPLMLLVVHLRALADDVADLQPAFGRRTVRAVLVGGILTLPLLLTFNYYHDRRTLHTALDYVYSPSYTQHYDLDAGALARTLAVVRQHKDRRGDIFESAQQPYLSMYYNWLVLDNLTLSDTKIAELQNVFVGPDQSAQLVPVNNFSNSRFLAEGSQPALRQLTARSTYDAHEQTWISWVDLEIANTDPGRAEGEYSTTFELPEGCWISNYYLDINGHREPGLLAERKAATWVYHQVLNEHVPVSHDPGLLAYTSPHQLALHVYPVVQSTPRQTGFQILHREPLTFTIGRQSVQLGTPGPAAPGAAPVLAPGGGVVYLSAAAKQQLPLVQRRPYYHFLLDVSAAGQAHKDELAARVRRLQQAQPLPDSARYTLVNTYATPVPAGTSWQAALQRFPNAGGCYLTGAMRRTLAEAQQQPAPTYPMLVVVTPDLAHCVLPADFADLHAAYPESDLFYVLQPDGTLQAHSLAGQSALAQTRTGQLAPAAVRAWPNAAHAQAYVPATDAPSVVLTQPQAPLPVPTAAPGRWATGLLLHGYNQWQALHPEAAERERGPFIQASFQTGILTPLTAYLSLENDAQKAALRRKQADVLSANANLDAEETTNDATAVPLDDYAGLLVLLALSLAWVKLSRR
ncbi:MAG: MSEP-CTERM sorting domain-containing protein [Janthinobacterium lividum]